MRRILFFLFLIILTTSCFDSQFEELMGWNQPVVSYGKKENEMKDEKQINATSSISNAIITKEDLFKANYSPQQLKIMRNEIFARHGYRFKMGGAMDTYFRQKDWYEPKFDDVNHLLSEIEKQNIQTISNFEKSLIDNTEELEEAAGGYGYIQVENLRLRYSPSLNAETITLLPKDSFVNIKAESNYKTSIELNGKVINDYWYQVITEDDKIGWVHGCCIEVTWP